MRLFAMLDCSTHLGEQAAKGARTPYGTIHACHATYITTHGSGVTACPCAYARPGVCDVPTVLCSAVCLGPPMPLLNCVLCHPCLCSAVCLVPSVPLLPCCRTCLLTHPPTDPATYPFTYRPTYLPTHPTTYLPTCPPTLLNSTVRLVPVLPCCRLHRPRREACCQPCVSLQMATGCWPSAQVTRQHWQSLWWDSTRPDCRGCMATHSHHCVKRHSSRSSRESSSSSGRRRSSGRRMQLM